MYYVRGNKADYQEWAAMGNKGWDWDTVLPYFKKSERFNNGGSVHESISLHGKNGYLGVTTPIFEQQTAPLFKAFKDTGHKILEEVNGFEQLGYAHASFTIDKKRQSSAFSFLTPIKNRPNLFTLKSTLANKIIFDSKRAVGVEIQDSNGNVKTVRARKEIILSAGALNSPQLLMLSGIGPKDHLSEMGIETLVDSPNVGTNLQDHVLVPIILTGNRTSTPTEVLSDVKNLLNTTQFPVASFLGHIALNKSQSYPDYQVTGFPLTKGSVLPAIFCSNVFEYNDEICTAMAEATSKEVLFALVTLLHPKSRGKMRLKSKNPKENALLYADYLSNKDDVKKFAQCILDYTSVVNAPNLKEVKSEIADLNVKSCTGIPFASQEYWEC